MPKLKWQMNSKCLNAKTLLLATCHCEHLKGAWQSPILVIYILGFDIVWDLEIGI
jgi:hypothetical protein